MEIKQKDCEIELLKKRLEEQCQLYGTSNQKVDDKIKVMKMMMMMNPPQSTTAMASAGKQQQLNKKR